MKENNVIISCVLLILCLAFALFLHDKKTSNLHEVSREVELKVSNYRLEKKKYQDELSKVKSEYKERILGKSRVMLLFYEIDDSFYEDIYPILNEYDAVGTICISEDNIPGINFPISFEDFNALLNDGWQSAMYWDGMSDINLWYTETTRLMAEVGVQVPTTLYIHESNNTSINNLAFEELGFKNIVVKKDKFNLSHEITRKSLHQINAVGWFTTTAAATLQTLSNDSNEATFIIGLTDPSEAFEPSQFSAMMGKINLALNSNKVILTTFDKAEEYRLELKEKKDAEEETYLEKIEDLENKIAHIDALIEKEYTE